MEERKYRKSRDLSHHKALLGACYIKRTNIEKIKLSEQKFNYIEYEI